MPNTALAKEAGLTRWDQGLLYLADFVRPYHLWIPLLLLAVAAVPEVKRRRAAGDRDGLVVAACVSGAALLHAAGVVRLGGDFMHARLLLPSLLGLLLPVAALPLPRPGSARRGTLAIALALVAWCGLAAARLRPPYTDRVGPHGIADERAYYVRPGWRENPILFEDYVGTKLEKEGGDLRAMAAEVDALRPPGSPALLLVDLAESEPDHLLLAHERKVYATQPGRVPLAVSLVVLRGNIGIIGHGAGPRVHLVDKRGLADALAARLRLESRRRPGHEKWLPGEWAIARFAAPLPDDTAAVRAAREALACGPLRELLAAVTEPLTPARMLANARGALTFHRLRVPANPWRARAELCGGTLPVPATPR